MAALTIAMKLATVRVRDCLLLSSLICGGAHTAAFQTLGTNQEDEPGGARVNTTDGMTHIWVSPGSFQKGSSPGDGLEQVNSERIDSSAGYGSLSAAIVSTSDLSVPHRARKELAKANASLAKQDLPQALRRLIQAISIYPNYAIAYNNLGVVYARLGDAVHEQYALEKAILLNPDFSLAYLNLGRMDIASSDFSAAENKLRKAATLDPSEPVTLTLLAYAQLMEGHYEDAISTSRDAHGLKRPHAFAHRIAARALELEQRFEYAITELRVSLEEEPTGPRSESARKELAIVQTVCR
jgi:tetratricopeptide (TPR) repeat protein